MFPIYIRHYMPEPFKNRLKLMQYQTEITFQFNVNPGAHERHLIRRNNNVLFGERATEVTSDVLKQAQKMDQSILERFMFDFRELVTRVAELQETEDSEVILAIKEKLDKLYAVSVSVSGDQSKVQASIKTLLRIIMTSIKKGATQDPKALQEIAQEESAREAHFIFLESKLVADILDPESPIDTGDLLPSLLSAEKDDLALATQLFDTEQLNLLLKQGKQLLDALSVETKDINKAAQNYIYIEGYLTYLNIDKK